MYGSGSCNNETFPHLNLRCDFVYKISWERSLFATRCHAKLVNPTQVKPFVTAHKLPSGQRQRPDERATIGQNGHK